MESTRPDSACATHALAPVVRPTAVCPVCQHHHLVRVSGVMRKHRSWTGAPCTGSGMTPIPIPVRQPDMSPAGYFDGKRLDRFAFLSLPLLVLLHVTRADVREVADPGLAGTITPVGGGTWRWVVRMPVGGDLLDHDLTVRALLAAAHGVDVTDWPNGIALREA